MVKSFIFPTRRSEGGLLFGYFFEFCTARHRVFWIINHCFIQKPRLTGSSIACCPTLWLSDSSAAPCWALKWPGVIVVFCNCDSQCICTLFSKWTSVLPWAGEVNFGQCNHSLMAFDRGGNHSFADLFSFLPIFHFHLFIQEYSDFRVFDWSHPRSWRCDHNSTAQILFFWSPDVAQENLRPTCILRAPCEAHRIDRRCSTILHFSYDVRRHLGVSLPSCSLFYCCCFLCPSCCCLFLLFRRSGCNRGCGDSWKVVVVVLRVCRVPLLQNANWHVTACVRKDSAFSSSCGVLWMTTHRHVIIAFHIALLWLLTVFRISLWRPVIHLF